MHRSSTTKSSCASAQAAKSIIEGQLPSKHKQKARVSKTPTKKACRDTSDIQESPSGLHSTQTTSSSATPSTEKKAKKTKVCLFILVVHFAYNTVQSPIYLFFVNVTERGRNAHPLYKEGDTLYECLHGSHKVLCVTSKMHNSSTGLKNNLEGADAHSTWFLNASSRRA